MRRIRYAVAGLGHITQNAVLPGFKNAKNSALVALITGDPKKRKELAKRYRLSPEAVYSYEEYEQALKNSNADAVFIGLPNHLHCEYTLRAAKAGVHVLCEKPMAITEKECQRMIHACDRAKVKLMIAYRLHFEEANLEAIKLASSGKLGDLRIFTSTFSQQVDAGNVRVAEPLSGGGGSVYDMGVYCINAARYLFRDEPIEVIATSANNGEIRFRETDEMTAATLRFPKERLAIFTSSFGAAPTSEYTVIGTHGHFRLSPAYDYSIPLASELTIGMAAPKRKRYTRRDQLGAEIAYFSDCILHNRQPEPSGQEGLADVRIVQAIFKSVATRKPVKLSPFEKRRRPTKRQQIGKPVVEKPESVHAESPSGH